MNQFEPPPAGVKSHPARWFRPASALVLALYAAFLLRDVREPWTGLHDWNGAFYSQLARNLLRYPFDMHYGMPVVAVGAALPADGEWSFYPTHPPGLVWCIALSFRAFGEHEWAARLVPIAASLATLALLFHAVRARHGDAMALLAGGLYALLPMAGYFGRMPDQESLCLFLMLAAVLAADRHLRPKPGPAPRIRPGFVWSVCIFAAIWVDWVAIILAGLVGLRAWVEAVRGRITAGHYCRIIAAPVAAIVLLFVYLIRIGFAGRAADLFAVFTARAGLTAETHGPALHAWTPWTNTVENLTLPILLLAVVGLAKSISRAISPRQSSPQITETNLPRTGFIDGLNLLAITGVLWVALFRRQYLVHQYWLVYLGPACAILAASGLLAMYNRVARYAPRAARAMIALIIIVIIAASHFVMMDLHQRVHCPMSDITAWQTARQIIAGGISDEEQRRHRVPPVLLVKTPIQIEKRGNYAFRNIIPPQFAYYFDLPFWVEPEMERIAELLPQSAGLLIPTRLAAEHSNAISTRLLPLEHHSLGTWELLRPRIASQVLP